LCRAKLRVGVRWPIGPEYGSSCWYTWAYTNREKGVIMKIRR